MHARMQCLHAPVHHLRETRYLGDVANGDACVSQSLRSSAGADDFNVEAIELACEINDARFVGDAYQRAPDVSKLFSHEFKEVVLRLVAD